MKIVNNRKNSEKKFHNDLFSGANDPRKNQELFYPESVKKVEEDYLFKMFGEMNQKKVLIIGIGNQASLIKSFIKRGSEVVAIDISIESVNMIKNTLAGNNFGNKYTVLEMDCENITLEKNSFDFVFGRGIIHHLDVQKCIQQTHRVLKKGGKIGFIEPLGTNPMIQLYRYLTPKARTPDEHPLKMDDLRLFSKNFVNIHLKFLYVFTLLSFPLRILLKKNENFFLEFFHFFNKIDQLLLKIPGYKLLCWTIIISGEKNCQ